MLRSPMLLAALTALMVLAAIAWSGHAPTGAQNAAPAGHTDHGTPGVGATPEAGHRSPYADAYDPDAEIRALGTDAVAQIRRGGGASLALPAELNGVPGPRHVLDLADELSLSANQQTRVQGVFDRFQRAAVPAGERYLIAEQALEEGFRTGALTEQTLPDRVAAVSQLEGELVAIHLIAHLQTAEILAPEQIEAYNRLRGYR